MKKLLAQEEAMIPELFFNLRRAFIPLMHDDAYNAMAKIADEIEKAGYSYKSRLPQLMKSSKRQKQSDSSQAEEPFNNGNTDELANEDHLTKKAKVEVEPTPMTEVMCETKGQDRYCAACYELV